METTSYPTEERTDRERNEHHDVDELHDLDANAVAPQSTIEHQRTLVDRHEIVSNRDRPPLLSWGAIFGGVVFVMAISWLLNLLGAAIGVSVLDATEGAAFNNGLATGAVIWTVISWLTAFFVGALFTARLSGKIDETAGMLHGMALWGVATTILVILGYLGISGLMRTTYEVATSTASSTVSAATGLLGTAQDVTRDTVATVADSRLGDNIKARVKRRAASVIARMEAAGGATVSTDEVRQAIEAIDAGTIQQIATHIVMGEMTQARETLAAETTLSDREVREIVAGIENEFERQLGMAENDTGLVGDISTSLKGQLADFVATLDAEGGANVTKTDVREALNQLDRSTMQTVATRLMNGDSQGAKDAMAATTSLSTRQINDIVDGVYGDISRTVNKYQEQAAAAVETASTYAQAVMWTIFTAAAMALAVSLFGGWLGTESSRRLEVELHRDLELT